MKHSCMFLSNKQTHTHTNTRGGDGGGGGGAFIGISWEQKAITMARQYQRRPRRAGEIIIAFFKTHAQRAALRYV